MQLDEDSVKDLAEALERQIKAQGEAAKLARPPPTSTN